MNLLTEVPSVLYLTLFKIKSNNVVAVLSSFIFRVLAGNPCLLTLRPICEYSNPILSYLDSLRRRICIYFL